MKTKVRKSGSPCFLLWITLYFDSSLLFCIHHKVYLNIEANFLLGQHVGRVETRLTDVLPYAVS
jgi:hypothetical protein